MVRVTGPLLVRMRMVRQLATVHVRMVVHAQWSSRVGVGVAAAAATSRLAPVRTAGQTEAWENTRPMTQVTCKTVARAVTQVT